MLISETRRSISFIKHSSESYLTMLGCCEQQRRIRSSSWFPRFWHEFVLAAVHLVFHAEDDTESKGRKEIVHSVSPVVVTLFADTEVAGPILSTELSWWTVALGLPTGFVRETISH